MAVVAIFTGATPTGKSLFNPSSFTNDRPSTDLPSSPLHISSPIHIALNDVSTEQLGNGIVWGQHIWGDKLLWAPTISDIQQRHGYTPGVIGGFYHVHVTTGINNPEEFIDHAKQVCKTKSWFFVTLEPSSMGLNISEDTMHKIAQLLHYVTNDLGVTILLRWAHEMNGVWYPWSQLPLKYVKVWRQLYNIIKPIAPKVRFVWSPNVGISLRHDDPRVTSIPNDEFNAMDTNHNGFIDMEDDPYAPYFPGKEYVDYIGISIFWFGPTYPERTNALPDENYVINKLTKPFDIIQFARDVDKPFVISESAGVYYPKIMNENITNEAIKQAIWQQLINIPTVKLIVWFDIIKHEDDNLLDAALSDSTSVINKFKQDTVNFPLVFSLKP